MNLTDRFLDSILKLADAPLSPGSVRQVERCILDYICVTFAGRKMLGDRLAAIEQGAPEGNCEVLGTDKKLSVYPAAFLNGFAAHFAELDDGNRTGAPHLEAVIISAMLAVAQSTEISFERFIKGIIVGYEATTRLSSAMQPGHKQKGFHATGTCGTIGVALAAGYALGYTRTQLKSTLSAAAAASAGLLHMLDDDSELKPYNVAGAITRGLEAAFFGRCGLTGPDDVLSGKRGFLSVFTDETDLFKLMGAFSMPAIYLRYVKPYASCRHSHPAVECALTICGEHDIDPAAIQKIEIQTYKQGIYGHDQTDITSVNAARMSTPYSVAAATVLGSCGIEAFTKKTIARKDIIDLVQKVSIAENARMTEKCPEERGAAVTFIMHDGSSYTAEVGNPLGEPEHPLSDEVLEAKFHSLMTYARVYKRDQDRINNAVRALDRNYDDLINGRFFKLDLRKR
ncbi:MAG: MmgE/PrpD family protein [Clostridia bacterium]|nr:MmgE/PrpD family protein [Clostridia bacterium]